MVPMHNRRLVALARMRPQRPTATWPCCCVTGNPIAGARLSEAAALLRSCRPPTACPTRRSRRCTPRRAGDDGAADLHPLRQPRAAPASSARSASRWRPRPHHRRKRRRRSWPRWPGRRCELDGVKHMVLTTGTPRRPDRGAAVLADSARAIKAACRLPIQAQCEPPDDFDWFARMKSAGVDSLGMHLEAVTEEVRRRIMPGKAEVPVARLPGGVRARGVACSVAARSRPTSWPASATRARRSSRCASDWWRLGVYPFVVPFVPIAGTPLEHHPPPQAGDSAGPAVRGRGASCRALGSRSTDIKAGCGRCGACSSLKAAGGGPWLTRCCRTPGRVRAFRRRFGAESRARALADSGVFRGCAAQIFASSKACSRAPTATGSTTAPRRSWLRRRSPACRTASSAWCASTRRSEGVWYRRAARRATQTFAGWARSAAR